ncbi:MAG: hypothetical protein AMXMBFR46_14610 [Acidimicrobiia bacterium]
MMQPTDADLALLGQLVVVSHHPEERDGGVVASLRSVAREFGIPWEWTSADAPSVAATNADLVLFNGAFSLQTDAARDLLRERVAHGSRSAVYWHETGWALRRFQGLDVWDEATARRRARRWVDLARLLPDPLVCHLAASATTKVAVVAVTGVDPRHVALVYEAAAGDAPRRERPHPTEELRVCAAGGNNPRKNADGFARLAEAGDVDGMPTTWTWYGDNETALASPVVRSPGECRPLVDALATHDVYLGLSLDEPFSVAALEALSVGLPVLCLEGTGMSEVVPPGWVLHCEREVPAALTSMLHAAWPEPEVSRRIADRFTPAAFVVRVARAVEHHADRTRSP